MLQEIISSLIVLSNYQQVFRDRLSAGFFLKTKSIYIERQEEDKDAAIPRSDSHIVLKAPRYLLS